MLFDMLTFGREQQEVEIGGRSGPKRAVKVIPKSSRDRRSFDISDNEIRICKMIKGEIERLRGHSGEERSMNLVSGSID